MYLELRLRATSKIFPRKQESLEQSAKFLKKTTESVMTIRTEVRSKQVQTGN